MLLINTYSTINQHFNTMVICVSTFNREETKNIGCYSPTKYPENIISFSLSRVISNLEKINNNIVHSIVINDIIARYLF